MTRTTTLAVLSAALSFAGLAPAQPRRPPAARAPERVSDHVYIVRPGDTLRRVAGLLQVSPRDLAGVNGLRAPYAMRVGQRLRLPPEVPQEVLRTLPRRDELRTTDADTGETRAHRAGMVRLVRVRDDGELAINFTANPRNLRVRVEQMLRARNGTMRIAHPRLLRLFPTLSDRFGGRRIVILSGYRPHRRALGPLPNRHAQGYAVDLRVEGVPTSQVFAFCQTLTNMGCGYSPRADYVHIDGRPTSEHWTYRARTGSAGDANVPPEDDVSLVLEDAAPL